jgi:hypothetical protein
MKERDYGTCASCGKLVSLYSNGTVWAHRTFSVAKGGRVMVTVRCDGSGQAPQMERGSS